jgi:transcriptional regulator with XRE-family HTH domain
MNNKDLGTIIRDYCAKNKMSQKAFGELLGVSQPTVNDWVGGKTPSKTHEEQIMAILNAAVAEPEEPNIELSLTKRLFEHFSEYEIPVVGKIIAKLRS